MTTSTEITNTPDELHPDGAERPSEAAMREADEVEPVVVEAPAKPKRKAPARKASTTKKRATSKRGGVGASAPKRTTARDAVAKVLADGQPRSSKEITSAAAKLATLGGKTPEASIRALLSTQAKKPDGLVVAGTDKGTYRLRQTGGQS